MYTVSIHVHTHTSYVLFSLHNTYCIILHYSSHTQALHRANPVRWNQDRQQEQGGVEWEGYGMLDHTVHPLLHTGLLQHLLRTCCNAYADQQWILELTK